MNNYEDNAEEFDCDYTQELVCPLLWIWNLLTVVSIV